MRGRVYRKRREEEEVGSKIEGERGGAAWGSRPPPAAVADGDACGGAGGLAWPLARVSSLPPFVGSHRERERG